MNKLRADELIFNQGLTESRELAKRLVMAGKVICSINGQNQKVDKPGHKYKADTSFALVGIEEYVSRGAYKLITALEYFELDVSNFTCLDAGASTGGFTDCLLKHGAAKVYAIDVGTQQLHERLRQDPRVISMEQTNLRSAPADLIPEPIDLIVADVSFISLTLVLPPCMVWLKPGGLLVALIKPQFELGSKCTEKGVIRDPFLHQQAIDKIESFCQDQLKLNLLGTVPAQIKGPKGNQEFLICLRK